MITLLPETLEDLWKIFHHQPDYKPMAGGTDLLVRMGFDKKQPPALVCLEKIHDLKTIKKNRDGIRIGSGVTLTELLKNDLIQENLPILHTAISTLGSPLIRNMGTLGGNICTASPAGDTLPALYLLGARVTLYSDRGNRILSLDEFIQGPGRTLLADKEILGSILIPPGDRFNVHHFEKVGQRKALAIAVVSLAALLRIQGGVVEEARLAWGSVGPTIVRSREAEKALEGRKLTLKTLNHAADLARSAVSPISDVRASADYRRRVAGNLLLRLAV